MNIIEHKKFVCSDATNNNNKFWEYIYHDDNTVIVKHGRIGSTCAVLDPKYMSKSELATLVRSKLKDRPGKPPYREIEIVAETVSNPQQNNKEYVKQAALKQLITNSSLTSLVEKLVEANKHELYNSSGGQLKLNTSTGVVSTPIGIITKDSILKARDSLNELSLFVNSQNFTSEKFIKELNNYLMLVPQKVGHAKGWHLSFLPDNKSIEKQNSLLDQLEVSSTVSFNTDKPIDDIFSTKIEKLTDIKEIKRITDYFNSTINGNHQSKHLTPIAFYKVVHQESDMAFNKDGINLENQMQLWHGTRVFNVLSILKQGLFCPPKSGTFNVTGRLFADGIYFSDQSTKSLNYSYGYWDRNQKDNNCFMFLFDVGMGKMYTPTSTYESLPKKGYDSTFAKANVSGVLNNEFIVYRNSQATPRFLIEFA